MVDKKDPTPDIPPNVKEAYAIASLAVQAACKLTKELQSSIQDVTAIDKPDTSPVTVADFAVQAILTAILHRRFPDDTFLAEESADALRSDVRLRGEVFRLITAKSTLEHFQFRIAGQLVEDVLPKDEQEMMDFIDMGGKTRRSDQGRVWVMDPIDGTATFMKGQQYVINCALLIDGVEALGIIGCPILQHRSDRIGNEYVDSESGCLVIGIKGGGTWVTDVNPKPDEMNALQPVRSNDQLVFTDDPTATSTIISKHKAVAARLDLQNPWPEVPFHSSVMKYATLGLGGATVCIRIFKHPSYISNIWDHAGGVLIYTEAGGKVSDSAGKPIDFSTGRKMSNNFGLICAPEQRHAEVLRIVQDVMADARR